MNSIQSVMIRGLLQKSDMWNKPLPEIRKTMEGIKGQGIPKKIIVTEERMNGVNCIRFGHLQHKHESIADRTKKKVILYFHGGGFCLGIYHSNREFVARLAEKSGCEIYMPDYRLAPENPYPAALEDAMAAYTGILDCGYQEKDIIIMGDSSGGALAVAALLSLKQKGIKMPSRMAFITPLFDLTGQGESFVSKATKDPFKLADPLGIAKNYIGSNNPELPTLSPLFGDLSDLPPVLIHAAEYDVFYSDSVSFIEKARASGVKAEIKVWEKMWHIFPMQDTVVPEAAKALKEISAYVNGVGINN